MGICANDNQVASGHTFLFLGVKDAPPVFLQFHVFQGNFVF